MKNTTMKSKILSLIIMLTMLIGMIPLSGIVSYAVESMETCEHVDENVNGLCDTCNGFLSEPDGEIRANEALTKDVPQRNSGFLYLTFTPIVTDTYVIKASKSTDDPLVYVYDSNGDYIGYDDDNGESRLFYATCELSAGETYYIAVAHYYTAGSCTVKVHPFCEEHVSTGSVTCKGDICAICDVFFGESESDSHVPEGPTTCIGTICSLCDTVYGEPDLNNHFDNDDDNRCDRCNAFTPDTQLDVNAGEILTINLPVAYYREYAKFVPEESGVYFIKSYETGVSYDPFLFVYDADGNQIAYNDDSESGLLFYIEMEFEAGKVYYIGIYGRDDNDVCRFSVKPLCNAHVSSGTVNCLGTYCSICGEYYGESNGIHTPGSVSDCRGTLCSVCYKYFGDPQGEHVHSGDVNCIGIVCSVCNHYFGEGNGEHTPWGEQTCLGTRCQVCWEFFGEIGDHVLDGEADCRGTQCSVCEKYFGEAVYDHTDDNVDSRCDVCNIILTDQVITVGEHTVFLKDESYVYYKFIPTETSSYLFMSNSAYDPKIYVYNENGALIDSNDDRNGYNFYLEISLVANTTYYIGFYEYDQDNHTPITIAKLCNQHIPGEHNCLGYLCTVCGVYFGEAGNHDISDYDYDEYYHHGACSICNQYLSMLHQYGLDGKCECGYFVHEHQFNSYAYDPIDHWLKCSHCSIESGEYSAHEYDENNICVCGREKLIGLLFGNTRLSDGEYLDNNGNVSSSRPNGGYAYYKDGVLTLSDFSFSYDVVDGKAFVTESNLEIVLNGKNVITSENGDAIYSAYADITFSGEGHLFINTPADYDGIDMYGATLTFNGGNIILKSGDHGIELDDGAVVINDGLIIIEAGDDGFDLGNSNITINGGIISIEADDNGIDVSESYSVTINDGHLSIYADEYSGIETGDLVITGGDITINTEYEEGIFAYGVIVIDGGNLMVHTEDYPAIAFGDYISIDNVDDYEIMEFNDYYVLGFDGTTLNYFEFSPVDGEQKTNIDYLTIQCKDMLYTGNVLVPDITVYDHYTETWLVPGVDFTVVMPEKEIKDAGVYELLVVANGMYVGVRKITIVVHHKVDITLGENAEADVFNYNNPYYSYFKFVPEKTATYAFTITSLDSLYIYILEDNLIYGDGFDLNSGVFYIEIQLEAGKAYYLDVSDNVDTGRCKITVEIICNDHVGGEATYTDRAVCEICGESYGEVLVCSGHRGGVATYDEAPVCIECGAHYGEKLVCDHMCHKGGIYAIIWDIYEFIYDLLGIKTTCECGHTH